MKHVIMLAVTKPAGAHHDNMLCANCAAAAADRPCAGVGREQFIDSLASSRVPTDQHHAECRRPYKRFFLHKINTCMLAVTKPVGA